MECQPFFCSGRSLIHYSRGLKIFHFALSPSTLAVLPRRIGFSLSSVPPCSISIIGSASSGGFFEIPNVGSLKQQIPATWKYMVRFWWTSRLRDLSWWLRYTKTRSKWPCIVFSWLSAGSLSLHTILLNLNMLSKVLQTQLLHMLYSKGPLTSCQAVQPPRMIVLGWIRLSTQQTKNDILYSSC